MNTEHLSLKSVKTLFLLLFGLFSGFNASSQTVYKSEINELRVSGYIRSGFAREVGGKIPVGLQMPGALNKFSLGNQPDTYTELEIDYMHYLDKDKTKSVEVRWMTSYYEAFKTKDRMNFNPSEQLYVRLNNLFGRDETIWFGKRFYDRYAIHMLDRQWLNPGQKTIGLGMENLLPESRTEGTDIKWGIWRFDREDVISYKNQLKGNIENYTADVRLVKLPVGGNFKANFALNYVWRKQNDKLGYEANHGLGAFTWLDYLKGNITNTTALLYRKGSKITDDHWTGKSIIENPGNDNIVLHDLSKAYSVELSNNFLYDDKDRFAVNGILMAVYKDLGTRPKIYINGVPADYGTKSTGSTVSWLALGVRPIYYISKQFRLTAEITHELIDNKSMGVKGNMSKLAFTPEFSLGKGFYTVPVLRPYITYARWSDGLKGYIASGSEKFSKKTSGVMFGLQFEMWW